MPIDINSPRPSPMARDDEPADSVFTAPDTSETAFAPAPAWERGKGKRRGFGAGRATQPSKARPVMIDDPAPVAEAAIYAAGPVAATETPMSSTVATTQPQRTRTVQRSGLSPLAMAAGVAVVALVAAGAWYASQPREEVATLTPGQPTETAVAPPALAPEAPSAASDRAAMAMAAPPPASASSTSVTRSTTTRAASAPIRVARARPAAAPSAEAAGVDTSAALPAGPMPYSASVGSSASPSTSSNTSATSPMTVNPAPMIAPPAPAATPPPAAASPPVVSPDPMVPPSTATTP